MVKISYLRIVFAAVSQVQQLLAGDFVAAAADVVAAAAAVEVGLSGQPLTTSVAVAVC